MLTDTIPSIPKPYRPRKNGCSYIGFWMRGARRRPGPGGFFSPRTKTPKQYWLGTFWTCFGVMPVMLCSLPWHTDSHDHRYRIFWGLLKQIRFNMVCGLSVIGTREGNHCRNNGGNHGWNANIFFCVVWILDEGFQTVETCACQWFLLLHGADFVSAISCRGLDKAIFFAESLRADLEKRPPPTEMWRRDLVWRFRPETLHRDRD